MDWAFKSLPAESMILASRKSVIVVLGHVLFYYIFWFLTVNAILPIFPGVMTLSHCTLVYRGSITLLSPSPTISIGATLSWLTIVSYLTVLSNVKQASCFGTVISRYWVPMRGGSYLNQRLSESERESITLPGIRDLFRVNVFLVVLVTY